MMNLLTRGNPKTAKGEAQGYLTSILHLAPKKLSGKDLCLDASPACVYLCLNTAGRGGIFKRGEKTNKIQLARLRKAKAFNADRIQFLLGVAHEIRNAIAYAREQGLIPAFRLNGTSDIPWEDIRIDGKNIFEMFPDVQFYDYTKTFARLGHTPANYHLTFSRSEKNEHLCQLALAMGFNVAVVFDHKREFPVEYLGRPTFNADESDLRFRDLRGGYIAALKAKGRARKDQTGFVVR